MFPKMKPKEALIELQFNYKYKICRSAAPPKPSEVAETPVFFVALWAQLHVNEALAQLSGDGARVS